MRASAGESVDVPATADGYELMGRLLGFAVTTDKPGGAQVDKVAEEIIASLVTAELIEVDGGGVQQRGGLVLVVAGEPVGSPDQRRGAGTIVASLSSALDETGKGVVVAGPIESGARDGVVGAVRRVPAASQVSHGRRDRPRGRRGPDDAGAGLRGRRLGGAPGHLRVRGRRLPRRPGRRVTRRCGVWCAEEARCC